MRAPLKIAREIMPQFLVACAVVIITCAVVLPCCAALAQLHNDVAEDHDAAAAKNQNDGATARQDLATAISKYQQILAKSPQDLDAEIGLAQAYRGVHNYDEARNLLQRAAREHPRSSLPLAILGELEIEMQNYDEAIRHFSDALVLKPSDTSARIWLAVAHKSKGDLAVALAQLGKAIAQEPKNALAYYERARIYSDQNKNAEALRDAEKAVELQPNAPGRLLLAKILLRPPAGGDAAEGTKRCSRAVVALEPLASTESTNSDAGTPQSRDAGSNPAESQTSETLFLLSRAYECAGQSELAAQTMVKFEAASKNDRTTRENQTEAKHLVQQANDAALKNDFHGALDLLQQALAKDPSSGAAYSQVAKLYYSAGNMDKASGAITEALARDPYQPDFLYVAGKILEKEAKLDEALAAFARTTLVNPKESDAYFEMGVIYQRRNDRARALAAYKKAVELSPDDPEYRRALEAMK